MGGLVEAFAINAACWCIRLKYDYQGVKDEFFWILACFFWSHRLSLFWKNSLLLKAVFALFFLSASIYLSSLLSYRDSSSDADGTETKRVKGSSSNRRAESSHQPRPQILKPLVFPARTTHTRLFPKKHSFSYCYLLVGIPIGWKGSLNCFLSVDFEGYFTGKAYQQWWPSWFTIMSTDYLCRGSHAAGLKGKLDDYLHSQDEDPRSFPHAYLVTAPRFLGYAFNPVSFWYLYNEGKELKAMILEVNNTFDERRIYFLKTPDLDFTPTHPLGPPKLVESEDFTKFTAIDSNTEAEPSIKFVSKWAKDFHVSPFNSRKGSYALSACDPFYPSLSGTGSINNLIKLHSSKDHVKIVSRLFSTAESIDPSLLSVLGRLKFIASWWWVGLVTFPRVLREAGKLFFRRKLSVWYRPEVLKGTLGRHQTRDERYTLDLGPPLPKTQDIKSHFLTFSFLSRILEYSFRAFLRSQVEHSNLTLPLKYTSNSAFSQEEIFYPSTLKRTTAPSEYITLTIATPFCYALIARTPNPANLFLSPSPYMHTSHPASLSHLFLSPQQYPSSYWLRITSLLLQNDRQNPLDNHALAHLAADSRRKYEFILCKLLLSDGIFFGQTILFDILFFAARVLVVYSYTLALSAGWHYLYAAGVMGFASFSSPFSSSSSAAVDGWTWARLSGVHIWWSMGQLN